MNNQLVITLIITVTVSTVIALLQIIVNKISEKRYDYKKQIALIDPYREMYERKIYDLENRLLDTQKRWEDTNHLILSSIKNDNTNYNIKSIQDNNFLNQFKLSSNDFQINKKSVFVLTPYNKEYYKIFKVIQEICSLVGLSCSRGDEEYISNDFFTYILKKIISAHVIIAVIDGRSPNVFYELGIAHALGKKTILVTNTLKETPADLNSRRLVVYSNLEDLEIKLREELMKAYME